MIKIGGLGATPPRKFLIQCLTLWLKMHISISCMPLVIDSAASIFYKRHPSRWPRRHSYIYYFQSQFEPQLIYASEKGKTSGGKTPFTRGAMLRTRGHLHPRNLHVKKALCAKYCISRILLMTRPASGLTVINNCIQNYVTTEFINQK